MGESIDLKEYIQIFKRRGWILLLLATLAIAISGVLNFFFIQPIYQAELTLMVNNKANTNAQLTQEDMDYSAKLAETYKPVIKSRKVTSKIKKNLNLNMTNKEIANSIEMTSISGPVMSIKVNNTNPQVAADIANEVSDVFGKELKRIAKVVDGIEIIDTATKPTSPVSPNKIRNMTRAAIVAIVISIFIIFLLEYLDNKVKTPQDIEKCLGIPLLGVVPEFQTERKIKKLGKKRKK
jgi:capsular polysaccharide biosynthesis protein